MCRNIRTLFNFDPPATDEEIRAASLQFVRKLSGFTKPSKANEPAFARARSAHSSRSRAGACVVSPSMSRLATSATSSTARARSAARFGA